MGIVDDVGMVYFNMILFCINMFFFDFYLFYLEIWIRFVIIVVDFKKDVVIVVVVGIYISLYL